MNQRKFDKKYRFVVSNIEQKLAQIGTRLRIVRHILALFRYLVDPEIHWTEKVIVVGGLIYFIIPIDVIPDFIPLVGYSDDAAVIAAVVRTLGKRLAKYYD